MPIPSAPTIYNAYMDEIAKPLDSGDFDATFEWAINRWANIADKLLQTVIPVSTTSTAARAAFIASLSGLTSSPGGIALLQTAFVQYATVLATGMTGAGFIGTPPPLPPLITTITTTTQEAEVFAASLETLLITWAKTGTATPSGGGAPITWS